MASSINGTSTNSGGLISTGDDSGILNIQTNETTAISIDASQRAAFVAGTATLPAITTTGDTNTGIFFPAADTIAFSEGGAESMRIDSSGSVGIGTTTLTNKLNVAGAIASTSTLVAIDANSVAMSQESGFARIAAFGPNSSTGGNLYLYSISTNGGVQNGAIIDSNGNMQIGTTSNPQSTKLTLKYGSSANWGIGPTSNGSVFFVFNDSATGVQLTSGNQAWAAQSDERVKTDLVPIENGLAKVTTLRAFVGRLKKDESGRRLPFLIAQDVQAVLPEAVDIGEDEDETLSLRYSDVIPLLVASIKELKAINDTQAETITALTARIVALENK
jgi:hypothetical protein